MGPNARIFANPLHVLAVTDSEPHQHREDRLVNTSDEEEKECVLTFLDYLAVFDSVSHKFLDEALDEAGYSHKTRDFSRGIYLSASAVVRAN